MRTFAEIEQSIQVHLKSLIELGRDFRDIREGAFAEMDGIGNRSKAYNERLSQIVGYPTLQEYWKKRWNITESYVRHIIQAAEIIKELELAVTCDTAKLNEFTVRPLATVPKEDRPKVFANAQAAAKKQGRKCVNGHVQKAVEIYRAENPDKAPSKKGKSKPSARKLTMYQRNDIALTKMGANTKFRELTKEQIDPGFNGNGIQWAEKHGHVRLETAAEREQFSDRAAFSEWIGVIQELEKSLAKLLGIRNWSLEHMERWIRRTRDESQYAVRHARLIKMLEMLQQAGESVGVQINWLKENATEGGTNAPDTQGEQQ